MRFGIRPDCLEHSTGIIGTFQPEWLEPMTGLTGKNDAEYPLANCRLLVVLTSVFNLLFSVLQSHTDNPVFLYGHASNQVGFI
jgi:hypothetical protein